MTELLEVLSDFAEFIELVVDIIIEKKRGKKRRNGAGRHAVDAARGGAQICTTSDSTQKKKMLDGTRMVIASDGTQMAIVSEDAQDKG